jgi:hypothetical protein
LYNNIPLSAVFFSAFFDFFHLFDDGNGFHTDTHADAGKEEATEIIGETAPLHEHDAGESEGEGKEDKSFHMLAFSLLYANFVPNDNKIL